MGAIGWSVALSLMLAACTDFAHGVADKPLPNDPRLIGQWQFSEGRGLLFISAAGPARLRGDAYDAPACDHLAVHPEAMGGKSLALVEVDPTPRPDCPN